MAKKKAKAKPAAKGAGNTTTVGLEDMSKPKKKGFFESIFSKPNTIPLRKKLAIEGTSKKEQMKIVNVEPLMEAGWEEVEVYPVHEPYAYVRIKVYTKTR
jgi:hypothetical protein